MRVRFSTLPRGGGLIRCGVGYSLDWFDHACDGTSFACVCVSFSGIAKESCERLIRITFGTFSLACFLSYLWSTHFVPETANVSLEEMDTVFGNGGLVGREDEAVVRTQVREPFASIVVEHTLVFVQIEENLGLRGLIRELAAEREADEDS